MKTLLLFLLLSAFSIAKADVPISMERYVQANWDGSALSNFGSCVIRINFAIVYPGIEGRSTERTYANSGSANGAYKTFSVSPGFSWKSRVEVRAQLVRGYDGQYYVISHPMVESTYDMYTRRGDITLDRWEIRKR